MCNPKIDVEVRIKKEKNKNGKVVTFKETYIPDHIFSIYALIKLGLPINSKQHELISHYFKHMKGVIRPKSSIKN